MSAGQGVSAITPVERPAPKPVVPARPEGPPQALRRAPTSIRGPVLAGLAIVFLFIGGSAGWALLAPLNSAVIAHGNLVVESNRRDVQHLEGGIVRSIHVRDGASVAAGDLLISLDPTRAMAALTIVRGQMDANRVLIARLRAEQGGEAAMTLDEDLTARAQADRSLADVIQGQAEIFRARRASLNGQIDVLRQRLSQLEEQINGQEAQERSRQRQIAYLRDELAGVNELLRHGYAPRTRALALSREVARLEGERGEYLSTVARTRQQMGETQLQILQIDRQFREEVAKSLQDAQNSLREQTERLVANEDIVKHLEIRAPAAGTVVGLNVFTVGGVVPAGRTLLQIVPQRDVLIIEGQVQPQDIEVIREGQVATVSFPALPQRSIPVLTGHVTHVSADRYTDERTGQPYYKVRVVPDEASLALVAERRLIPGMPAEVSISTGERTAALYLVEPFLDRVRNAMRER